MTEDITHTTNTPYVLENLWSKINFKTKSIKRNYATVFQEEIFVSEFIGDITKIRIDEHQAPKLIGEYSFTIWNFQKAKEFNIDLKDTLKNHKTEIIYKELNELIDNNDIELDNVNHLILVNTFLLHPDFRKYQIFNEFIEFLYRDYFNNDDKIILLAYPIQNNNIDFIYMKYKQIYDYDSLDKKDIKQVSAYNYYRLEDIVTTKTDDETNLYKLYSVAAKAGFKRISESNIFILNEDFVKNKILQKIKDNEQ